MCGPSVTLRYRSDRVVALALSMGDAWDVDCCGGEEVFSDFKNEVRR